MTTTTVRLPLDLKARLDKLAAASGQSTHAFMLEKLAESAERGEQQRAFDAEVAKRWARFQRSGEHHTLGDLRNYATALARGEKPQRPKPRAMETHAAATQRAAPRKPLKPRKA